MNTIINAGGGRHIMQVGNDLIDGAQDGTPALSIATRHIGWRGIIIRQRHLVRVLSA